MTTIDRLVFGVSIGAMVVAFLMLACATLFTVGVTFWAYIW